MRKKDYFRSVCGEPKFNESISLRSPVRCEATNPTLDATCPIGREIGNEGRGGRENGKLHGFARLVSFRG